MTPWLFRKFNRQSPTRTTKQTKPRRCYILFPLGLLQWKFTTQMRKSSTEGNKIIHQITSSVSHRHAWIMPANQAAPSRFVPLVPPPPPPTLPKQGKTHRQMLATMSPLCFLTNEKKTTKAKTATKAKSLATFRRYNKGNKGNRPPSRDDDASGQRAWQPPDNISV